MKGAGYSNPHVSTAVTKVEQCRFWERCSVTDMIPHWCKFLWTDEPELCKLTAEESR